MVFKRGRRNFKKRNFKRKSYRRRFRRARASKGVHYFKRTLAAGGAVYNWSVPQHVGLDFALNQLPDYQEFTNLFDQYRICAVKIKFVYSSNSQEASGTTALPNLLGVKDYDDATPLSLENDYLEYENFRVRRLDKPFSVYLRPRIAMAAYSGAFTAYASSKSWLDCDSPGVAHYGFKYMIDPIMYAAGATQLGYLHRYVTYYIKTRQVR